MRFYIYYLCDADERGGADAAGFIGGNKTREGAMLMAQKALLF